MEDNEYYDASENLDTSSNFPDASTRLREKINSYKTNSHLNNRQSNKTNSLNSRRRNRPVNELASRGLQSLGVPKAVSDKVANDKNLDNAINQPKKNNSIFNFFNRTNEKEEESKKEEGILKGLEIDFKKVVKIMGIVTPIFVFISFCCLIIVSSNTYYKVIGLGQADQVSDVEADKKIREKLEDNNDSDDMSVDEDTVTLDYLIDVDALKLRNKKLEQANLAQVALFKRKPKYTEASLDDLEDFYPGIKDLSEEYDEKLVYYFFLKMYNLNQAYESYPRDKNDDHPLLDLPLLMATLTIQSDDMNQVFLSNLDYNERKGKIKDSTDDVYKYETNWSGYIFRENNSAHDMEILAQHMVSKKIEETCTDSSGKVVKTNTIKESELETKGLICESGETYSSESKYYTFDNDKYQEFLKEFVEEKYYINGSSSNDYNTPGVDNPFASEMVILANKEYESNMGQFGGLKYINAYGEGFGPGTPWCVIFVWYLSANTTVNGKSIYPDIVKLKSAGTGNYMRYFNSSTDSNINFYYNDSCSILKDKNGKGFKYTPKPGDYIFFDWDASFYDITSGTQDHTGMVEKYEAGIIYTIEGNSGNTINKRTYSINDCRVIGFGSWY